MTRRSALKGAPAVAAKRLGDDGSTANGARGGEPTRTDDAVALLADELGATVVEEYGSVLSGEVSPTDYRLPENLTYDEWAAIGATLHRISNAVMWWLGSWWLHGEHQYGERASQAAPLGYKAETLARAARVCERVPAEERDERLSFGHYVALSRLSETRPRGRIRDRAIAEGWSVRDTERAVTRARRGDDGEPDPFSHLPICGECRQPWPCETVLELQAYRKRHGGRNPPNARRAHGER
jgi:hypothetical protein